MRIRTKIYKYLVSYNFIDKNGHEQFGRDIKSFNKKINTNDIEKMEINLEIKKNYKIVCTNNVIKL